MDNIRSKRRKLVEFDGMTFARKRELYQFLGYLTDYSFYDHASNLGFTSPEFLDFILENKITYKGEVFYTPLQMAKKLNITRNTAKNIFEELNWKR